VSFLSSFSDVSLINFAELCFNATDFVGVLSKQSVRCEKEFQFLLSLSNPAIKFGILSDLMQLIFSTSGVNLSLLPQFYGD